ncbi:MAG: hypothetical protein M1816_006524 [Peltula sp. TS41687]|nr:MAG: hypothetical protein M1816_006524 [Peltula sp. TS41687]
MSDKDLYNDDGLFVNNQPSIDHTDHVENDDQCAEFVMKQEDYLSPSDELYVDDSGAPAFYQADSNLVGNEATASDPSGANAGDPNEANAGDPNGFEDPNDDGSDFQESEHDPNVDEPDDERANDQQYSAPRTRRKRASRLPGGPSEPFVNPSVLDSAGERAESRFLTNPRLQQPAVFTIAMSAVYEQICSGVIDLNAEYQRGNVWQVDRMSGLIKSIAEQFYIPPVIFNLVTREDPVTTTSETIKVCVDGKQRLTSIKNFMDGMVPVKDYRGHNWWYKLEGRPGRAKSIFSDAERRTWDQRSLLCYELQGLPRDQEEDLFSRVQLGISLNNAEKLKASSGPWLDLANEFERKFSDVINLSVNKRASGWMNILSSFCQMIEIKMSAPLVPVLKTSPASIRNQIKLPLTDAWKAEFWRVFTTFSTVASRFPKTFADNGYRKVKTFSPVELIAVAALIFHHKDRTSATLLKDDILYLRDQLRHAHEDLRTNSAVWKNCWSLIDQLEQVRGAVGGGTALKPIRAARPEKPRRSRGNKDEPTQVSQREEVQQSPPSLRDSGEPTPHAASSQNQASSTEVVHAPQVNRSRRKRNTAQFTATNRRTRNMARPSSGVPRQPPVAPVANMSTGHSTGVFREPPVAPVANMSSGHSTGFRSQPLTALANMTLGPSTDVRRVSPRLVPVANMTSQPPERQKRQRLQPGVARPENKSKRIKLSPQSD